MYTEFIVVSVVIVLDATNILTDNVRLLHEFIPCLKARHAYMVFLKFM